MQLLRVLILIGRRWPTLVMAGLLSLMLMAFLLSSLPARIIHHQDRLQDFTPDYMVVLMGDSHGYRAQAAWRWYQRLKNQPIILLPQPEATEFINRGLQPASHAVHGDYLIQQGIDPKKIRLLNYCRTTSTLDEAHCVQHFLGNKADTATILLVTSWSHSSRAKRLFSHVFNPQQIRVVGTEFPQHHWWSQESSMLSVFEEWLKWIYWRLQLVF